ncbi:MAG TPA: GspE/PulE family protein [Patescibacteria group bacterium]
MDGSKKKIIDAGKKELEKKAAILDIAYLAKTPKDIDQEVINVIPKEVSRQHKIVAFEKSKKVIKVAMQDPQDADALNVLRFIAENEKMEIEMYLASADTISEMLAFYEGPSAMVVEAVESFKEDALTESIFDEKEENVKKRDDILKDAPVTKLVQVIISHAVEGHASDIHIEPMEDNFRVRFRVDGILHVSLILPKEIGPVVISRIKILANLKIEEKRKPQDGRFRIQAAGKSIDFRVSTLPVLTGEKVVLRLLDKEEGLADLETLGLMGSASEHIQQAIKETYGMILLTGPTGSGKSTTLYALLKILNNEEKNIITLEDPIEYNLEGLNQSQIKPEIGYTFASGLRTILRQDPNVIMVGEIRDAETAELAVHAALTGHLMFSTLHTNTAIGAIPRLIDMGIEPFLLSSSLRMVIAQRLVRKICADCKKEKKISDIVKARILEEIKDISENERKKLELDTNEKVVFYYGKGCDACNGSGFKGRLAIYEVVYLNESIKNLIVEKRGNEQLIMGESKKLGYLNIKQDGIVKVLKGMTTIEEVERVTGVSKNLIEEEEI